MSEKDSFSLRDVGHEACEFGKAFVESGIANPWNGIAQIIHAPQWHVENKADANSTASAVGHMAGFIADFAAVSFATRGVAGKAARFFGGAETGTLATSINMGASGAIEGGLLTPSQSTDHLALDRFKQATVQAGTMGVMGLVSGKMGGGFEGSFMRRVGVNAIGGTAGGATNAILSEAVNGRVARTQDILRSAGTYAAFGAAFGAVEFGLGKVTGKDAYPVELKEKLTPFQRLSDKPILSPRPGMFDSEGAFNPTATRLDDGSVVMLYRAQDANAVSTVGRADSVDGINFVAEDKPVLAPSLPDETKGIEDPRLTADPINPDQWRLTATAWDGKDAKLADWVSSDLQHWQRNGTMADANVGSWNEQWTKSGAIVSEDINGKLVPAKIDGKYWMYYMGNKDGIDQMGLMSSKDGQGWVDATDKPVLAARPNGLDAKVVEPGPAAILRNGQITLIYNAGDNNLTYRALTATFDGNDPTRLIHRDVVPKLSPELDWEKKTTSEVIHQAPNVVFVQGAVPDDNNGLILYYGGADSQVGVAHTQFVPVNVGRSTINHLNQVIVQSAGSLTQNETSSDTTRHSN